MLTPLTLGSSDFDKIFENCYGSCSFGLAKDIQDCFIKGSFLYFVAFSIFYSSWFAKFEKRPFWEVDIVFFEIDHVGYKKNQELYADFKNANLP